MPELEWAAPAKARCVVKAEVIRITHAAQQKKRNTGAGKLE
jgi:hypothetical protein